MEPGVYSLQARTDGTVRLLCPGAPQSPAQSQCHRIYVIMLFSECQYICVYAYISGIKK